MGAPSYKQYDASAYVAFDITPNDSTDLTHNTRGIYCGGGGNLKVDMVGGGTVTFTSIAGGVIHPIQVKRVYSTGTGATSIIGLY